MSNLASADDSSARHPRVPPQPAPLALGDSFLDLQGQAASLHGTARLALLRADQHARWRRGQKIPAEVYLDRFPFLTDEVDLVIDLVYSEFLLRCELGEPVDLAEYLKRFPRYADMLLEQVQMEQALGGPPGCDDHEPSQADHSTVTPARGPPPQAQQGALAETAVLPRRNVPGYDILGVIGRGGMGVVYKAVHAATGRVVALKMLLAGEHSRPEQLSRLRNEAEALAQLANPHIVSVYEIGEVDGLPYFSMEYVEGETLADAVRRGPMPVGDAAGLIEVLARVMHDAHQHGVIHRDLKPANVLLTRAGTPKLSDFGVAKRLDRKFDALTGSDAIYGTPSYMSPEQATGGTRDVGPATDVYSLGAILYELLTGVPPFHLPKPPANLLEALDRVRAGQVVPPRRGRPDVPEALQTVCMHCLAKEPEKRYRTALELADDLAAFAAGKPIQAREAGAIARAWARHWGQVAWGGLFGLAVALLALLLARLVVDREADRVRRAAVEEKASAKEFTALLEDIADRANTRAPGWTREILNRIRVAVPRLHLNQKDTVTLRTEAAACLAAVDLCPQSAYSLTVAGESASTSADGRWLAVAAAGADGRGRVQVIDLVSGQSRQLPWAHPPGDRVATCLLSAGGTEVVVGTTAGRMFHWGPEAAVPREWVAHAGAVTGLALSPDGKALLSCGTDGVVKRWPVTGAGRAAEYRFDDILTGLAVRPGGASVACCASGAVHLLDPVTLRLQGKPVPTTAHTLAFSRRGDWLAVGTAARIAVLDAVTGEEAFAMHGGDFLVPGTLVLEHLEFNATGSILLAVYRHGRDQHVVLWDVGSGNLLTSFPSVGGCRAGFAADGTFWCVGERQVQVYELVGQDVQSVIAQHASPLSAVSLSADGEHLACAAGPGRGRLNPEGELTLWNLGDGSRLARHHVAWPKGGRGLAALAFSPGGGVLAVGGASEEVASLNAGDGKKVTLALLPRAEAVGFAPGGAALWAAEPGGLRSWGVTDTERLFQKQALTAQVPEASGAGLAVGLRLALVGDSAGNVVAVDAATGKKVRAYPRFAAGVQALAVGPNDTIAAIGTRAGGVYLMDPRADSRASQLDSLQAPVTSLAFSRDGALLAAAGGPNVCLWRRVGEGYQPVATLRSAGGIVKAIALSPTGNDLAVVITTHTAVRLWHLDRLGHRLAMLNLGLESDSGNE